MRTLVSVLGILFLILGLGFLVFGFIYPWSVDLSKASTIQVQQIYTEANYFLLTSIASFVFGGICTLHAAISGHSAQNTKHLQAVVNRLYDLRRPQTDGQQPVPVERR